MEGLDGEAPGARVATCQAGQQRPENGSRHARRGVEGGSYGAICPPSQRGVRQHGGCGHVARGMQAQLPLSGEAMCAGYFGWWDKTLIAWAQSTNLLVARSCTVLMPSDFCSASASVAETPCRALTGASASSPNDWPS